MSDVKKLYNTLLENGYTTEDLGDEGVFTSKMSDANNRKELYDWVKSDGFDLGDYDAYEKRLTSNASTLQEPSTVSKADNTLAAPMAENVSVAPTPSKKPKESPFGINANIPTVAETARGMVNGVNVNPFASLPNQPIKPITEFGEGVKEGGKQLVAGAEFAAGETLRPIVGTSEDDKAALERIESLEKEGKDVAKNVQSTATISPAMALGLKVFGPKGSSAFVRTMEKTAEANIAAQKALKEADGNVEQAKLILEEKANKQTLADTMRKDAERKMAEARPTKSWGWVGSMIPQMVGTGVGLGMTAVTKNPMWAQAIGIGNMAGLTTSAAGSAMAEARQAGASNAEVWTAGLLNGVIENVSERFALGKYTKRLVGSAKNTASQMVKKAVSEVDSPARKELADLLQKANKQLDGKLLSGKNVEDYLADIMDESLSEGVAEGLQTITPMLYQNPDKYPSLFEIVYEVSNNALEGIKGGLFMGPILGGLSKSAEHRMNRARRKAQGFVDVAEVINPNGTRTVVEVVKDDNGEDAYVEDGKYVPLKSQEVGRREQFNFADFERGQFQNEQDESYDIGKTLETTQEMKDANTMLQKTEAGVRRLFGDDAGDANVDEMLGDNPLEFARQKYEEDEGAGQTILDYLNAKATVDGIIDKAKGQIKTEVEQAEAMIDSRKSLSDGMIHPAVMKTNDRQVYVINGNVERFDDGNVDTQKSSDSIIVMDATTGKKEFVSLKDLLSIDVAIDPEVEKKAVRTTIGERIATDVENKLNGVLAFNLNDTYEVLNPQGERTTVQVVSDNGDGTINVIMGDAAEPIKVTKNAVQTMADNLNSQRADEMLQGRNEMLQSEKLQKEAEQMAVPTATETPAEVAPAPRVVPTTKDGKPDFNAMDAEMFVEEYASRYGEENTAKIARKNIAVEREKIAKLDKKIDDVTDPNQIDALYEQRQASEAVVNRYNEILERLGLSEDANETEADRKSRLRNEANNRIASLFPDGMPNVESFILADIATGNRLRWSDKEINGVVTSRGLGAELGLSETERRRRLPLIGKDAMTPEEYAETLRERLDAVGIRYDESSLRDAVLDVYSSVDSRKGAWDALENMSKKMQEPQADMDWEDMQQQLAYNKAQENVDNTPELPSLDTIEEETPISEGEYAEMEQQAQAEEQADYDAMMEENPPVEEQDANIEPTEAQKQKIEQENIEVKENTTPTSALSFVFNKPENSSAFKKQAYSRYISAMRFIRRKDGKGILNKYKGLLSNDATWYALFDSNKVDEEPFAIVRTPEEAVKTALNYDIPDFEYVVVDNANKSVDFNVMSIPLKYNEDGSLKQESKDSIINEMVGDSASLAEETTPALIKGAKWDSTGEPTKMKYSRKGDNFDGYITVGKKKYGRTTSEGEEFDILLEDYGSLENAWNAYEQGDVFISPNLASIIKTILIEKGDSANQSKGNADDEQTLFRNVYHGSGSEFDKFDHSFVGTGEGHQAFGWGTYVTEVEGIGKQYARMTSKPRLTFKGDMVNVDGFYNPWRIVSDLFNDHSGKLREMRNAAERYSSLVEEDNPKLKALWEDVKQVLSVVRSGDLKTTPARYLYSVEIPDDNGSNYIYWDKVVSDEAIDNLQSKLNDAYGEDVAIRANLKYGQDGEHLYKKLERVIGDKAASEFLNKNGYVGISYPADNGKAKGARNYVIFNEQDLDITNNIRFRTAESAPVFYSNAEYAVKAVKQEKATPEQWLKMIEKNGGLKAGEDKWLGLSDWLKSSDKKTLTKQEVLDFIKENQIQIEEVENAENPQGFEELKKEYDGWLRDGGYDYAWDKLVERYGYDSTVAFDDVGGELVVQYGNTASKLLGGGVSTINSTRLKYTTNGLDNKREIALTVPTIESWNESDEIHFGDAGNGRAIAWVRFGETTDSEGKRVLVIDEVQSKRHQEGREKGYNNPRVIEIFTRLADIESNLYSPQGLSMEMQSEREALKAELESIFENDNPVMKSIAEQIDEKKSKRAVLVKERLEREDDERVEILKLQAEQDKVRNVRDYDYYESEIDKIKERIDQRNEELDLLASDITALNNEYSRYYNTEIRNARVGVSPAPFEKNWAELAMKRMLRYAAENGFDKVAWTTGEQQAERYDIGNTVDGIDVVPYEAQNASEIDGFDITIRTNNYGERIELFTDRKGEIQSGEIAGSSVAGKHLSDILGKPLANKIISNEGGVITDVEKSDSAKRAEYASAVMQMMSKYNVSRPTDLQREISENDKATLDALDPSYVVSARTYSGDGLRIGNEGMKAFYDQMIPSFMNKYGKKWGVKVGEVAMPSLEENNTMHSIDVTDAMRESVMQGQPLFRTAKTNYESQFAELQSEYDALDKNDAEALNEWRDKKADVVRSYISRLSNKFGLKCELYVFNGGREEEMRKSYDTMVEKYKAEGIEKVPSYESFKKKASNPKVVATHRKSINFVTFNTSANDAKLNIEQFAGTLFHENAHRIAEKMYSKQEFEQIWENAKKSKNSIAKSVEKLYSDKSDAQKGNEFIAKAIGELVSNHNRLFTNYLMGKDNISAEDLVKKLKYSLPLGKLALTETLNEFKNEYQERVLQGSGSSLLGGGRDGGDIEVSERDGGRNRKRDWQGDQKGQRPRRRLDVVGAATNLAESLGVKLNVIEDVNEITDSNTRRQRAKRGAKAWYVVNTDQVYFVAPNATSIEDAQMSVLHEVVAHKGLRDVVGRENFNKFLDKVFYYAEKEIRSRIVRLASQYGWNFRVATEEYLASLAEEGFDSRENRTFLQKVRDFFMDMLREAKIAIGFNISDNDMRYMLWRTYQMQKSQGAMAVAEDVLMQQKMGVGNFRTRPAGESMTEEEQIIADAKANGTYLKAPNGKDTNLTLKQWVQVRTKAFKKWFGDWERAMTEVPILKALKAHGFNNFAEARKWAKENIVGTYNNKEIGDVNISRTIIDKYLSQKAVEQSVNKDVHLSTLRILPQVLESSIVGEIHRDRDNNANIKDVVRLFGCVDIDGTLCRVKTTIKRYVDVNTNPKAYSYEVTEIELLGGHRAAHTQGADSAPTPNNSITIAKLLKGVKKSNSNEGILSYSQIVDANGEPKVVWHGGQFAMSNFVPRKNMHFGTKRAALERILDQEVGYDDVEITQNNDGSYSWKYSDPYEDNGDVEGQQTFDTETEAYEDAVSVLVKDVVVKPYFLNIRNIEKTSDAGSDWSDAIDMAKEDGFDGILYENWYEDKGSESYIAFNPNQIKSATDNVGTFDSNNDDIRFRATPAPTTDKARKLYDEAVRKHIKDRNNVGRFENLWHHFRESYQDSMLAVKALYDAILKETGNKLHDFEDLYKAENRLSSTNKAQIEAWERDYMKPLQKAILSLIKKGTDYNAIIDYLLAKSGLERNEVLAKRDAEQMAKGWEKKRLDGAKRAYNFEQRKVNGSYGGQVATLNKNLGTGAITQEYYDAQIAKLAKQRDNDLATLERKYNRLVLKIQNDMPEMYEKAWSKLRDKDYSGLTELTGEKDAFSNAAQKMVDAFESTHDTTELWKTINAATKATLRKSYDSGMMNKETFEKTAKMFKYYIPLRGWDNNAAADHYEYMANSNMKILPALKTAKGRTSRADDPIATIGSMGESSIIQGNRNLMKLKLLNFAERNHTSLLTVSEQWYVQKADGTWVEDNPVIPENATGDEVDAIVKKHEADMLALGDKASKERNKLNLGLHATTWEGQEHVVRVKRNGKEYQIFVNGNPIAAQAINGFTNPNAKEGWMKRAAQTIKNFMARAYTSLNPAFIIKNLSIDLLWAGTTIAIKEDAKYVAQYTKNIASFAWQLPRLISKWQKGTLDMNKPIERYFKEFIENGGETGFTQLNTVDDYKRNMARFIKEAQSGAARMPKKAWRAVWDGVEFLNRSAEDTTRFMTYMTSRQMGRNITDSIYDAKEVTVNFNKKGRGEYGATFLNFAYIFFNATIQSLTNFGRLLKHHPKKTTAALTTFASAGLLAPMLSMFVQAMLSDDDDEPTYWDLPEWVRRNNIVLYAPFTKSGYLTVPLPHELRPFYGMGELAFSVLNGKESVEGALAKAVVGFGGLLPFDFTGNGGNMMVNFTPTIAQPIAQLIINQDYFGTPIYRKTAFNELDPEWTKAYKSTNTYLVDATEFLNELTGGDAVEKGWLDINPAKVEHLFESYLGGMGKTLNRTAKTLSMLWDEDMREWRNVPILSNFYQVADERTSGSQINRAYFDAVDEAEDIEHLLSGYKKQARMGALEYAEKLTNLINSDIFKRYATVKSKQQAISELNKALRESNDPMNEEQIETQIMNLKIDMLEELEKLEKSESSNK